jgi:hypothetical protein
MMSRTTGLRAFMLATPLAFAGLLTQHPTNGGDFYTGVSEHVTSWLVVHYGAAVLFPLMALVVWLLIRDLRGRAATVARIALPVFAVFYGMWEAIFGIANGLLAQTGNELSGEARQGVREAVNDIVSSPLWGEMSVLNTIGGMAWVAAVIAAIIALKHAGVGRTALTLLGVGSLMIMHIPPIGPVALVCLSAGAYLIERHRSAALAPSRRLVPAA